MKTQRIEFNEYTQTYRAQPSNVWLASIKDDKLIFDSWDGLAKDWLTGQNKTRVRIAHIRRMYGLKIHEIMNNHKGKYDAITMNHPLIVAAAKHKLVRIISATQQEFTEAGIKYFFEGVEINA